MKHERSYEVCTTNRNAPDTFKGSFSYGVYDAAKAYTKIYLTGYEVLEGSITSNERGHTVHRFEAVNYADQISTILYVQSE